ncbi:MAG: right-handed parallel beta-helix repeat-containing protein [Sphingomonas sp.]|jgi:hypothetical protein|uniref:right-handed parallel beta-helix repeat-containing protein n=1 Tax=Sphingomonas sp. TaxID=28214 RepID=UPI0035661518
MATLKRIALIFAAFLAGGLVFSGAASAQATRTWVSGVGDDANPCSRTAPCKTFAGSISKTAAGGEINCLDPGGYGAVTITKAIAIICDNIQQAGVLVASSNGIIINVAAGTHVTLSGLYFDGLGSTGVPGTNGVYVLQGGNVTLRNLTISGFRNGYGVNFANTATGKLIMHNVSIIESGVASNTLTGGVLVQPAAGITADVSIFNSRLMNNENVGLRLDTIGIVGSVINATVDDVTFAGNANGVLIKSPASTGTVKLMLAHSVITNSASYGMIVNGSGSTVRVGNSVISNNLTGITALASGVIASYGNNLLDGNGTDGSFTATIPTK